MTVSCDVLVVGVGCAGSVAALYLSKKGFDATLIEKQPKVGLHTQEKIDITEDSGINPIIKELNLPVAERTNKSVWFSPNYSLRLESKIHDLYFKRGPSGDCFEVGTVKMAVDNGANLILEDEPKKIDFKGGLVDSVTTKNHTIKPKVVIVADGFNSSLHKTLQIKEKRIATIVGYGVMGKDFNLREAETHIFLDRENAPGGYFFVAKTSKNDCVACVVLDESLINKAPKEHFLKFTKENNHLKEILKNAIIKNEFAGMSQSGVLNRIQVNNALLAGDAARTLDPLLGYGMRNSIISGYTAAEMCSSYLEKEDINQLTKYKKIHTKRISDTQKAAKMRKAFKKLDNTDLDHMVKTLIKLQEKGGNLDDIYNKKALLTKTLLQDIPSNTRLLIKLLHPFAA